PRRTRAWAPFPRVCLAQARSNGRHRRDGGNTFDDAFRRPRGGDRSMPDPVSARRDKPDCRSLFVSGVPFTSGPLTKRISCFRGIQPALARTERAYAAGETPTIALKSRTK